jgi:hypothetical protein
VKLKDFSIISWLLEEEIKVENGTKFELADHKFWAEPLRDWNPKQVWEKAAQVGGSTVANLKLLYAMKRWGINAIYTLPTDHDVNQFVESKTNRLIVHNPSLLNWTKDKDTIQQKRVGDFTAYFRGTFTERAALSVSADLLVHDEIDRSNRPIIEQYESRLQHSKYQWQWIFSNPSTPGNGVDAKWQISDKKLWHVTCLECKKAQVLSYEDNVDEQLELFFCKFCEALIDDYTRGHGEWVKTGDPKAEWSGYRFSLLFCPWVSARKIIELKRTKSPEYFSNFVLGEPYVGRGGNLAENEFFANLNNEPFALDDPIVIGLDTGLPNWMMVGNKHGLFSAGKIDGYDDVRTLLKRYSKSICIVDSGGDLYGSRQLQEDFPGRIYLCYFRSDRKTMRLFEWGSGEETGKVIADRNRMIQMVVDEFRDKRIPLRGLREDWQETWSHIANTYRTTELDAQNQPKNVWERSGPDHLLLAIVYWRLGIDKFGMFTGSHVNNPAAEPGAMSSFLVDPITKGVKANEFFKEEDRVEDWRNV